jgi:hypothetical protein
VQEWEQEGYVTRTAGLSLCINPLSVVIKISSETGKVKNRVCVDSSFYVNSLLVMLKKHMEDLHTISGLELKNGFSCVFDLENQFFLVKLAPEARKYFGFSIQDEGGGEELFYVFNMVYGMKTAVAVVTRLTKLLQSFLHNLGIYEDDGKVSGRTHMVWHGSVGSVSACWKAGPSSILGSAPPGGLSH